MKLLITPRVAGILAAWEKKGYRKEDVKREDGRMDLSIRDNGMARVAGMERTGQGKEPG